MRLLAEWNDFQGGEPILLPCPNCNAELQFLEQYGRHYCTTCGQYAPEGYGEGKGLQCPKCDGIASYMKEYDRYYCYKDREYLQEGDEPALPPPAEAPEPPPEVLSIEGVLGSEVPPPPDVVPETRSAPPAAEVPEPPPEKAIIQVLKPEEPKKESKEEPKVHAPPPPPVEPTTVAALQRETKPAPPAEPVVEPPKGEARLTLPKPVLVKEEIMKAKKAALMELAAAHGLETMGTKDDLRVRLLAEFNRLRREELRKMAGSTQAPGPPDTFVHELAPSSPPLGPRPTTSSRVREGASVVAQPHREPPAEPFPSPGRGAQAFAPASPAPITTPSPIVRQESAPEVSPRPPQRPAGFTSPKVINPCPTCGRELSYIDQYDRYYCYRCRTYAPAPVKIVTIPPPPRVGRPCATCGRELTYVEQYDRHYCYHCRAYAPLEMARPSVAPSVRYLEPRLETAHAGARNPCPTCGRELSYIARYARYYCYDCGRYAPPRPKHPCPNCGRALTFVTQYRRHYCYGCRRYAPVELTVNILAERAVALPGLPASTPRIAGATRATSVPHTSLIVPVVLSAIGLLLASVFHLLVSLPLSSGGQPIVDIDSRTAWLIEFLGFLLLGTGVVMTLVRIRSRR